jgi:hypothetical protein
LEDFIVSDFIASGLVDSPAGVLGDVAGEPASPGLSGRDGACCVWGVPPPVVHGGRYG